ncbi:ASKHA domain-containing protein [Sporomusa malonica]|uniref:ASKHA domain-containing protein n=1 Tax=Sporomusa malonica TaxID=112901 RepID=UPI0015937EC3|nr:ASKHA domain-containing protein [Sporomusa malonica]
MGKAISVNEGTTLLQAARAAGLLVEAPCDGLGTCGKCQVKILGELNIPGEIESKQLGNLLAAGVRLACQAKVIGPAQVELLSKHNDGFVTLTEGQSTQWPLDPPVHKIVYKRLDSEYDQSDLAKGIEPLFPGNYPGILQELSDQYKQGSSANAAIVKNEKLLDWHYQPGQPYYGVALDIGTTSVVAALFDLASGESMGVCSCLNPQTEFGGDVLTRISFASKQAGGTQILQGKIIAGINRLLEQLTTENQLHSEDIYEVVVAGNTTMQHLLLGVDPSSLAYAPYQPVFTQQVEVSPATLGLAISQRGVVTILPSAAAFVGADIVAGLLAVGLHHDSKTTLFIDIGTNGEIVVCKNGSLVGTSSAAGPALEGMNISCGCRAEQGAIESVSIADDGTVGLKVIGEGLPKGLCGSGLIDLISELARCGVITASGRFAAPEKLPAALASRLSHIDGRPVFVISSDEHICLSQKDVRQVQLAKGAIHTAMNLLLKEIDICFEDVDEILVAGAFGFHLKPKALVGIGLLPHSCQQRIQFVGNTAKEGAKAVLLNRHASIEVQKIGQKIKIVELSLHPEFQDYFVQALAFPAISQ